MSTEILPEHTPRTWPKGTRATCPAVAPAPTPFFCTGPAGHDGPHVAEGFTRSIARWDQ